MVSTGGCRLRCCPPRSNRPRTRGPTHLPAPFAVPDAAGPLECRPAGRGGRRGFPGRGDRRPGEIGGRRQVGGRRDGAARAAGGDAAAAAGTATRGEAGGTGRPGRRPAGTGRPGRRPAGTGRPGGGRRGRGAGDRPGRRPAAGPPRPGPHPRARAGHAWPPRLSATRPSRSGTEVPGGRRPSALSADSALPDRGVQRAGPARSRMVDGGRSPGGTAAGSGSAAWIRSCWPGPSSP